MDSRVPKVLCGVHRNVVLIVLGLILPFQLWGLAVHPISRISWWLALGAALLAGQIVAVTALSAVRYRAFATQHRTLVDQLQMLVDDQAHQDPITRQLVMVYEHGFLNHCFLVKVIAESDLEAVWRKPNRTGAIAVRCLLIWSSVTGANQIFNGNTVTLDDEGEMIEAEPIGPEITGRELKRNLGSKRTQLDQNELNDFLKLIENISA